MKIKLIIIFTLFTTLVFGQGKLDTAFNGILNPLQPTTVNAPEFGFTGMFVNQNQSFTASNIDLNNMYVILSQGGTCYTLKLTSVSVSGALVTGVVYDSTGQLTALPRAPAIISRRTESNKFHIPSGAPSTLLSCMLVHNFLQEETNPLAPPSETPFIVYAPNHELTDSITSRLYAPVKRDYTLANSSDPDSVHFAYAIGAPHPDTLILKLSGEHDFGTPHGLTLNEQYYLNDDGTESLTPGTVGAFTVIPITATQVVFTEVGIQREFYLPRRILPSPIITAYGGDPLNPSDSIVQEIIENVYVPLGQAQPGTIFISGIFGSQTQNPNYINNAPLNAPINPGRSWMWDGRNVTRIKEVPIAVNMQASSYGLISLDTVQLVNGVPTDATVAQWLEDNTANGLRLANGSLIYWGNDYVWSVLDDVTNVSETNPYARITRNIKSPPATLIAGSGITIQGDSVNLNGQYTQNILLTGNAFDFVISRLNQISSNNFARIEMTGSGPTINRLRNEVYNDDFTMFGISEVSSRSDGPLRGVLIDHRASDMSNLRTGRIYYTTNTGDISISAQENTDIAGLLIKPFQGVSVVKGGAENILYSLPNNGPSYTLNDTSIMIQVGTGTAANASWISLPPPPDLSSFLQYQDSLTVFATPTQVSDSLAALTANNAITRTGNNFTLGGNLLNTTTIGGNFLLRKTGALNDSMIFDVQNTGTNSVGISGTGTTTGVSATGNSFGLRGFSNIFGVSGQSPNTPLLGNNSATTDVAGVLKGLVIVRGGSFTGQIGNGISIGMVARSDANQEAPIVNLNAEATDVTNTAQHGQFFIETVNNGIFSRRLAISSTGQLRLHNYSTNNFVSTGWGRLVVQADGLVVVDTTAAFTSNDIDSSQWATLSALIDTSENIRSDFSDSLAVIAARVDTLPTGQGVADKIAMWTGTSSIGVGPLTRTANRLTLDAGKVLRLEGLTTAQLPSAQPGDLYYNSTIGRIAAVRSDNTRSTLAEIAGNALNPGQLTYVDANGRITVPSNANMLFWDANDNALNIGTQNVNSAGRARVWIFQTSSNPALRLGGNTTNITANADLFITSDRTAINISTTPSNLPAVTVNNTGNGTSYSTTIGFQSAGQNSTVRGYLAISNDRLDIVPLIDSIASYRAFSAETAGVNVSNAQFGAWNHFISEHSVKDYSRIKEFNHFVATKGIQGTGVAPNLTLVENAYSIQKFNWVPTRHYAEFKGFTIEPSVIINQDTVSGKARGIYINPTLTAIDDWKAVEVRTAQTAFFQSSFIAKNYFAGATIIGDTIEPKRQLDIRGGLRVLPDSLQSDPSILAGINSQGDLSSVFLGEGLSLSNDTLNAWTPKYISKWHPNYVTTVSTTEKKIVFDDELFEGTFTKTDSTITLPAGRWKISYDANVILIPDSGNDLTISILLKQGASSVERAQSIVTRNAGTANSVFSPSSTTILNLASSTEMSLSMITQSGTGTAIFYRLNFNIEKL